MKNTCGGCDSTWGGTSAAHCASDGCHRTFSSVSLFDQHRVGHKCSDPATLVYASGARAGEPKMRLNDRGIWVGTGERPGHWLEAA